MNALLQQEVRTDEAYGSYHELSTSDNVPPNLRERAMLGYLQQKKKLNDMADNIVSEVVAEM